MPRRSALSAITLASILSLLSLGVALAATATTTVFYVSGTNSNSSNAMWNTFGAISYVSTPDPMTHTVLYEWPDNTAVSQAMYGIPGMYIDATIYYRNELIYDPTGTPSSIWASSAPTNMATYQLPSTGFRYFVNNNPNVDFYDSSDTHDVILKAECAGTQTLTPMSAPVTLSKDAQ